MSRISARSIRASINHPAQVAASFKRLAEKLPTGETVSVPPVSRASLLELPRWAQAVPPVSSFFRTPLQLPSVGLQPMVCLCPSCIAIIPALPRRLNPLPVVAALGLVAEYSSSDLPEPRTTGSGPVVSFSALSDALRLLNSLLGVRKNS